MAYCLLGLTVLLEPGGGAGMQRRDLTLVAAPQLGAQELREQVVMPVPLVAVVESAPEGRGADFGGSGPESPPTPPPARPLATTRPF